MKASGGGGGYPGGTGKMVRSFLAIKTAAIEIATGLEYLYVIPALA